jgi:hypothetical protein
VGGDVTLRQGATLPSSSAGTATPLLQAWVERQQLLTSNPASASFYQPWLRLAESNAEPFRTVTGLLPGTVRATSFSGDLNLAGDLTLTPAPRGTIELVAGGAVNGLQRNGIVSPNGIRTVSWGTSTINVSDADPMVIPGVSTPYALQTLVGTVQGQAIVTDPLVLEFVNRIFRESGGTIGEQAVIQTKQALHAPGILHRDDPNPTRIYALGGDISGLTFFSPKASKVLAGQDILDVALYIQNVRESDISVVASGRDLIPYTTNSGLRIAATALGNIVNLDSGPQAGDIQISGPGSLQVLAGRNLDLGVGSNNPDGTGVGITSIGNGRNPFLPFGGATIVVGAGIGSSAGLAASPLDIEAFIQDFVDTSAGQVYLASVLGKDLNFDDLSKDEQAQAALQVFYLVLRDSGREAAAGTGVGYPRGFAAIDSLFPAVVTGDIFTRSRDIRTRNGGSISIFAPGGQLALANASFGSTLAPPGIITESGGAISIFTNDSVNIGIGRIFTLRGGNQIIWSSEGDIAAGSSAKTVRSAPPTRVLIDPQSAELQTDLSGLATGGGIGVLATVEGVPPGDVDLIAPTGVVDAGDAGIRVTGNLNIAATRVLNAGNIAAGGTTTGVPAPPAVIAPNISGLNAASQTAGAATAAAQEFAAPSRPQNDPALDTPSVITVEVLGYGGGEG